MPPQASSTVLVIDDHIEMARVLAEELESRGYDAEVAGSGNEALAKVKKRPFDVVITDLRMEDVDGLDILDAVKAIDASTPVLIMTAFGAIDSAIEAIRRGAYHYFAKPFQLEEVLVWVERALADRRMREENRALRKVAIEQSNFGAMVGRSHEMKNLFELIARVSEANAPVLIRGESGSGKELIARALHFQGARKGGPFIPINCAALPEALLESELFGHARGAFTGATGARRGLFLEASGGTLFLDEVGDLAPELQAKLLRVIEDGEVRAVGTNAPTKVDVRLIAATHRDLEQRVREGAFREDLFYRLNVVPIVIPPLRDRAADIPLLAAHFLAMALRKNPSSRVRGLAPEVIAALGRYRWPGNVRELENVIERLVIVSASDVITLDLLERHAPAVVEQPSPLDSARQRMIPLRQLENEYIAWVIERCGGNKTRAAEVLGIDVSTIHRRLA